MPLIFGVDYYPEQWPQKLWDSDFARMTQMGLQAIRIMEFAWTILEPRENEYDFTLFDQAIELAHKHKLQVVLGTPTATIPVWLFEKDPTILQKHPEGFVRQFGDRRQMCYNAPLYIEQSKKIVQQIAKHFAGHNAVIGWQVDNEIGHEGSDQCVCVHCQKKWPQWLQKKYGSIDSLNQTWGTVFWSTKYSDFSQIPLPQKALHTQQNPALLLDYHRFQSDGAVGFVQNQVDILRAHIKQNDWISTNIYAPPMSPIIDMEKIFDSMDFTGFDNYPVWGDMNEPLPYYFNAYVLSYIRGLKKSRNFTIFEQINGIQGHQVLGHLPPLGQIVAWTNQAIALGANQIFYFRWRTAPFGQEQLCNGILDPDNTDTPMMDALQKNIKAHQKKMDVFADQIVPAQACVIYDKDNSRLLKKHYMSKGLYLTPNSYMQVGYDAEMARHYAPYSIFNINCDVQSASQIDLDKYKIISLPMYIMTDKDFVARLQQWVAQGNTLILGWRAGVRDRDNWATQKTLPGEFSEMAGIQIKRYESLNETKVKIRIGIVPARGEVWADIVEPLQAKVLARYTDKTKHYKGQACITMNTYGQGKVFYLGTSPNPIGLFFLYKKIFRYAKIKTMFKGMGLEIISRTGTDGKHYLVAVNHTKKTKKLRGKTIQPYGFAIIPDQ